MHIPVEKCSVIKHVVGKVFNYLSVENVKAWKKMLNFSFSNPGVAKTSWRITVRQLESMIRLSEAMARMFCQDTVRFFNHSRNFRSFYILSEVESIGLFNAQ